MNQPVSKQEVLANVKRWRKKKQLVPIAESRKQFTKNFNSIGEKFKKSPMEDK